MHTHIHHDICPASVKVETFPSKIQDKISQQEMEYIEYSLQHIIKG